MTHGHFESTFLKYAFGKGGGGHKKEYAVYARENDDNYGRPLTGMEVVELFFTCLTLTFLNRSGNPATGSWQHIEKIQCMFSSELYLFMAF